MVNLKSMSIKFLSINILKKVIVILGCLLFLLSFIFPFYSASFEESRLVGSFSTYYWSYKVDCQYFLTLSHTSPVSRPSFYWFSLWFSSSPLVGLGKPWIFISLFILQVLTLAFGVVFIISNRRILSFEPIMFSIAVLVPMTYIGEVLSGYVGVYLGIEYGVYSSQYQLGYYLVYPAIAMFLLAFLLNEVTRRRQTTNRES